MAANYTSSVAYVQLSGSVVSCRRIVRVSVLPVDFLLESDS